MKKTLHESVSEETPRVALSVLLAEMSPYAVAVCVSAVRVRSQYVNDEVKMPEIRLHCDSEHCGKVMAFDCKKPIYTTGTNLETAIRVYRCRHCSGLKTFAIVYERNGNDLIAYKLGELPRFGKPLPPRLITAVRDERQLLFNGYQCEVQGMGIGALTYYRRIVEDYRVKLILEIRRVAVSLDADESVLKKFDEAAKEHQFEKSIDMIKDVFPERLLLKGQNPFKLLHSALSQDIHNASDQESLQLATSVRVVLSELVALIAEA